ncbi:MAG: hypothetical protein ACJ0DK_10640 [Planctomycetota bacterium]
MKVPAPHNPAQAEPLSNSGLSIPRLSDLVPLPLATLDADSKVPVDIYLDHDGDWVLCRRAGDLLSAEVRRELLEAGQDALWMPPPAEGQVPSIFALFDSGGVESPLRDRLGQQLP